MKKRAVFMSGNSLGEALDKISEKERIWTEAELSEILPPFYALDNLAKRLKRRGFSVEICYKITPTEFDANVIHVDFSADRKKKEA